MAQIIVTEATIGAHDFFKSILGTVVASGSVDVGKNLERRLQFFCKAIEMGFYNFVL